MQLPAPPSAFGLAPCSIVVGIPASGCTHPLSISYRGTGSGCSRRHRPASRCPGHQQSGGMQWQRLLIARCPCGELRSHTSCSCTPAHVITRQFLSDCTPPNQLRWVGGLVDGWVGRCCQQLTGSTSSQSALLLFFLPPINHHLPCWENFSVTSDEKLSLSMRTKKSRPMNCRTTSNGHALACEYSKSKSPPVGLCPANTWQPSRDLIRMREKRTPRAGATLVK